MADFVTIEKGLGAEGRIAVVRFDRGDGINALSPRSKRTTATRPSGPRPFSIVTKSATTVPPRRQFSATIA